MDALRAHDAAAARVLEAEDVLINRWLAFGLAAVARGSPAEWHRLRIDALSDQVVLAACLCRSSHALLPDFLVCRRLDEVATIGQVLALRATAGMELRALARRFDRPRATLRGWWDRFRTRSPTLLAEVAEVAIGLDPAPLDLRLIGEAAVFEALEQALSRSRRRFGAGDDDVWRLWSRISGGQLLATNTRAP